MALEYILFDRGSFLNNNDLRAYLNEYARGEINLGILKSKMATSNEKALSVNQLTDIDGIVSSMNAKSTLAEKLDISSEVYDVFCMSQSPNGMYQTAEEIQARLGFVSGT